MRLPFVRQAFEGVEADEPRRFVRVQFGPISQALPVVDTEFQVGNRPSGDEMVVDVIPVNRETTAEAFETVKDRFQPVSFARGAGSATAARNIVIDPRQIARVGEGGNTAFPFELWIYDGGGEPLLKQDMIMEQGIGMRFIFVDREGFGRYKLESSSTMTPK